MRMRLSLFVASSLWVGSVASASPITYAVTVNTSSVSGTEGALDFNFNPGPLATQFASLELLSFASDGSLASCSTNIQGFCPTGDVNGQLPATVTFDNGTGFNDYFDDFMFGASLTFDVSLYGPALSAPDGVSTSGSGFAFSAFSDTAGTIPALTTDMTDGFAFTVEVNLDGTTTVNNFSSQTSVLPAVTSRPEPGSSALVISSVLLLSLSTLRRIAWADRPT